MSGGMYAINRSWFYELGGYDVGMDMWGAENLEMSFRVSAWLITDQAINVHFFFARFAVIGHLFACHTEFHEY